MTKRMELNKKNNELDKLLNKENHAAMMDMVAYLRMAYISDYQVELVRQDLLDMALSAQERNEPLSQVIGSDYQSFCDEIIGNVHNKKHGEDMLQWLMYLCGAISILGAVDVVFSGYLIKIYHSVTSHSKVDISYPITTGFLLNTLMIVVVSYLIVYLICKYSFQIKTMSGKFKILSRPQKFAFGCLGGAVLFGYLLGVAELYKFTLLSINVFIYLSVLLIFFILSKCLARV